MRIPCEFKMLGIPENVNVFSIAFACVYESVPILKFRGPVGEVFFAIFPLFSFLRAPSRFFCLIWDLVPIFFLSEAGALRRMLHWPSGRSGPDMNMHVSVDVFASIRRGEKYFYTCVNWYKHWHECLPLLCE